jgi:hypothetical protein
MKTKTEEKNIEDTIKQMLLLVEDLTFQEKLKVVFEIIPEEYFHNFKYREEIQCDILGIDDRDFKRHGPDSVEYSLKSSKINRKKKKNERYTVTKKTVVGVWGRVDKEKTQDLQNTFCCLFNGPDVLFSLLIFCDDNFINMFNELRKQKQEIMKGNKQKMDSVNIKIELLEKYDVKYQIKYVDELIDLKF